MDPADRKELERLMEALASGDRSAMHGLLERFGDHLRGLVRRHLRDLHRHDLAADAQEVQGLVLDVALDLAQRAAGWSPDGALPWTWADRSIRALIVRHVGHPLADVEPERLEQVLGAAADLADADDPVGAASELELLADREPHVALLIEGIREVALTARDAQVHVEYRLQRLTGDPSPARTVGAMFGLRPDHVRQIDHRVRRRLGALVTGESRFAALVDLAWIDPGPPNDAP